MVSFRSNLHSILDLLLHRKGVVLFRWILDSAQDSDLAHFFGDLRQSEELSEIKPPVGVLEIFHSGIAGI